MTVSKKTTGVTAVATPSMKSTLFSLATLQDLAVGGAGHLLNREVANTVVADRVNGHPIALFERGVVVPEGAQDHGVASPGRQQVVDLRPHRVVATYAALRFR